MDGTALKVKRIQAHVKGGVLAGRLSRLYPDTNWSPSKVSRIEAAAHVEANLVSEYVAALATFTTNTTAEGSAA